MKRKNLQKANWGGGIENKAFTLIELLVVIILLGVIALIVSPIVINVIKKQEKKTFEESVYGLIEAVRLDVSNDDFKTPREYYYEEGKLTLLTVGGDPKDEIVKTNGKLKASGTIIVDGDGNIIVNKICNDNYCAINNEDDPTIVINPNEPEDPLDPMISLLGRSTIMIGIGESYVEPGVKSTTKAEDEIEYTTVIRKGNTEVDSIDTSEVSTYTITYTNESNGKTASVTRTVKVVDMKPQITITKADEGYLKSKNVVMKVTAVSPNKITSFTYQINNGNVETVSGNSSKIVTLNTTGTYTIVVTATDDNGHTNSVTGGPYKIDSVAPTINVEEETTISVNEAVGYDLMQGVTASDDSGEEITVSYTGSLGAVPGDYTITYTAIDKAGNKTTKTRKITVYGTEGPILNFSVLKTSGYVKSINITMSATSNYNLNTFNYEIFKDGVSQGEKSITTSGKSGQQTITLNTSGIYKIKLTASDQYNNSSDLESEEYKIDVTAPIITFNPETVTITNIEAATYDLKTGVTANDNVDGDLPLAKVTVTPTTLSTTPGTYKFTYKATDNAGNSSSKERTIIVTDGEKPVITINPNEQSTFAKSKTVTISATDNVAVTSLKYVLTKDNIPGSEQTINGASGTVTLNSSGNYFITVTAIDSSSNSETMTSGTYKIDSTAPVISVPASTTVKKTEVGTYNLLTGVSVTDNSGESITPKVSGSLSSTLGNQTITYTATDSAGNTATATRTITVVEADGPILNFSVAGSSSWRGSTTVQVTATDNSILKTFTYEIIKDNASQGVKSVSVTTNSKSASTNLSLTTTGTYYIKLTGSDQYGNSSSVQGGPYKIDVTNPTVGSATVNGTLGSNGWYTSNVTFTITNGTDAHSGHKSTVASPTSITSNTAGTTVTLTTTDNVGRTASKTLGTYKVDKNAPTITAKSTATETITQGDSHAITDYFTISYSTSGGSTVCKEGSTTVTNTSSLSVGTHTISCTATGGNGKSSSGSKNLVIKLPITGDNFVSNVDPGEDGSLEEIASGNVRFQGKNPNNYVKFNDELWRIIGVVDGKFYIVINRTLFEGCYWGTNGYESWPNSVVYRHFQNYSLDALSQDLMDDSLHLITSTDYAYGSDITGCLSKGSSPGYDGGYCSINNWLSDFPKPEFFGDFCSSYPCGRNAGGQIGYNVYLSTRSYPCSRTKYARGATTLKSYAKIISGVGTSSDPYILSL